MEAIYEQINAFRVDPLQFSPSCSPPPFQLEKLNISENLEAASKWHTEHMCDPVNHATCTEWCHLFGSCLAADRIRQLSKPAETVEERELIVKGPKHPFKHLVKSPGHCAHLLDPRVNSMGGSILGNLFILSLAWIPTHY